MTETLRSIRHAARSLLRAPAFTVVTVLTLVLGIGATTAIFSAIEAILLHPLPVRSADRVVFVSTYLPRTRSDINVLTPAEYQELSGQSSLFASVGAYNTATVSVTGEGEPKRVDAITTNGALFEVFGIKPLMGRFYDSSDVRANRRVVLLSYGYWVHRTSGSTNGDVIGASITLNDSAYTIVGVLPRGFDFPHGVGIWSPRQLRPIACAKLDRDRNDPLSHNCKLATTVARLRDGVEISHVRTVVAAMMTQWRRSMPQYYDAETDQTLRVNTLATVIAGEMRPILLLLFAASAFVLLIACVNVACLQLVRTSGRAREMALRAALGASRLTVAMHILAETIVISVLAGIGGVLVGKLIVTAMKGRLTTLPIDATALRIDPVVAAFALGATLVTTILCAVAPVMRVSSVDAGDVLRGGGTRNSSAGRRRSRFLSSAVIVQVAAALALVVGCAIAVEGFAQLTMVDPGFRADGLVTMRLLLPRDHYRSWANVLAFESDLNSRVASIPGVHGVATAAAGPYDAQRGASWVGVASSAEHAGNENASVTPFYNMISANYFDVLGIRLVAGRTFDESDVARFHADSPVHVGTVIIDETLARKIYPGVDAVGKKLGPSEPMPTIVGVVNATRESKLATDGSGTLYYPGADFLGDRTIIIRTTLALSVIGPMLRGIVHDLDRDLPIANIDAVRDDINQTLTPRRLTSHILSAFAGVSLLLAMLGIYGVLSYTMAQRRKEMGIRLALGAAPAQLLRFVVGGVARLVVMGIALGLLAVLAAGRYMQSIVYGVSVHDPLTIVLCAVVLASMTLLAAWMPARSAAALDPAQTLRTE
jgi:putative ABC transport system permease protein